MRAPWLESDDEFEGVGAHPLNPRYHPVDEIEQGYDPPDDFAPTPGLMAARQSLLAVAKPRLDGGDTSHHNVDAGPMNLNDAAVGGCWWWMHKATQSTSYVDPTLQRIRLQMRAADFENQIIYHWLSSTTDPERQAAHFLATIGELAVRQGVSLDAEEAGTSVVWCLGFLEAVEKVTKRPIEVYSGAFVSGGTIWTDERIREGHYGPRPMRLAAYTSEARAKALPGVADHPWHGWQYSSNGPVPGVVGRCDMNRIDDREIYNRACGVQAAPPIEVPPIPPTPPSPPILSLEEDDMQFIMRKANGDAWFVWTQGGRTMATGLGGTGEFNGDETEKVIDGKVAGVWEASDARADFWLAKVKADQA